MAIQFESGSRSSIRRLEDQAKDAQKQADMLACRAWNERMRFIGGPACPSPSISVALNGGYHFLEVICQGCRTHAAIELRKLRRPPSSEVHMLEGALVCRRCADPGGRRRSRSTVVALHQHRPAHFEAWWTDKERDRS